MFMDANPGEPVNVFVKLYPHLEELRAMFASKYDDTQAFEHLEQVVMKGRPRPNKPRLVQFTILLKNGAGCQNTLFL